MLNRPSGYQIVQLLQPGRQTRLKLTEMQGEIRFTMEAAQVSRESAQISVWNQIFPNLVQVEGGVQLYVFGKRQSVMGWGATVNFRTPHPADIGHGWMCYETAKFLKRLASIFVFRINAETLGIIVRYEHGR
jgi:hypothetical protein